MIRQDTVQMRMEIDGKQSISELGKQEMAAYEYKMELKDIKEEQSALERESKKVDKIRERYDKLTKQVKELEAAGKTTGKQYYKTADQLGKVSEQLRSAEKATKDLAASQARYKATADNLDQTNIKIKKLREEMGVAGMTMKQLRQYQRDLNRELEGGLTKGTDRYDELKAKVQQVNGAIRAQKADVNGTTSAWSKISTEIKRFGILALGYLGAQEIIGQLGNLVRGAADFSDAMTDVQKTTNLADREIKELTEDLGELNTRTARKELLAMAEIAGRLGIKGKKDIEGFVKAADQINVALGDSLGETETVMRELGKLTSTYKIQEAYGIEESLLRIGSSINELGMASTANEGNIVDFTRRMGGIAPLAKITIQEILGMGATLDSLGQTSETSSTALSKLFIKMAGNAKEYARFAKMEVQAFVDLMNKDANEAFLRVLEGIKDNSAGITELASTLGDLGEDGGRVVGVLGTLANNTKLLREQQTLSNKAFKEGTSITEEFNQKNENFAAALAKVQKWFYGFFVSGPALNFLEKSIGKIAEWVLGIDQATKALQDFDTANSDIDKKLPGLLGRYEELRRNTERSNEESMEMQSLIKEIAGLVPEIVTQFDQYGNAIAINTGKLWEFNHAQREARKLLNADAIEEQQNALKLLERDIMQVNWALNRRDEDGDLFKYVTSASGLSQKQVKLTADEIRNLQRELGKLQDQRLGRKSILEDLEGISPEAAAGRAAFEKYYGGESPAEETIVSSTATEDTEEKLDKMLDKFKEFQQKVKDLQSEAELNRLDKDSKDLAQIEATFQAQREKALEYYNLGYLDKENYDLTISQLNALQNEAQNLEINEQNQVIKDKRAKFQEDIRLMAMEDHEREIEQAKLRFDALISEAENLGLSTVELERMKLETIEELNKTHDEKLIQQKRATNEKQLRADMEFRGAQIDVMMEYSKITSEAISLIGSKGSELTGFQKALALVQIGIDTGVSIMKAELVALSAASAAGPAAPAVYLATKLSMIGSILSAAAKAKDLFTNSSVPSFNDSSEKQGPQRGRSGSNSKNSYFFGGATGEGMGFGDQYGEYAGYVHKHEYVIPQSVRREPIVQMQIEPLLESLRMRQFTGRSFYNGGESSPISKTDSSKISISADASETNRLLKIMINKLDAFPREIHGKWVYSELEDLQQEDAELKKRYTVP